MPNLAEIPNDFLQATIGNFGKWQCRVFVLMALLKIPIAWFQLGIVFMAPPTEFWCRQPEDFKHISTEEWRSHIHYTINNETHNPCYMGNVEYEDELRNTAVPCKWGYEYDKETVHSSIISEWNLVCGEEHLVDIVQVSFMCGVLLGGLLFGILADKYGRKKILMTCICIQFISGVLSAITPWYTWFVLVRFILAVANGGTVVTSFVMCIEVVSGSWRTIIPILYQIPFGIGNTIMAGVAYYIRDWRHLQLTLSCCSAIFVSYYWFLSESPRWLMAKNQRDEAVDVLEKAIRFNKGQNKDVRKILDNYFINEDSKTKFSTVFKNPNLRKATILLSMQWFLFGNIFYAFTQYIGRLGRNIFLNVAVGGLITIPGSIFCIFIIHRIGRKLTITAAHILTAISFLLLILIPQDIPGIDWLKLVLAGLSIIGLSMSSSALFLYTGEIFPTIVRNSAVGGCVMFFKVGGIIAPLILATKNVAEYLPLLVLCLMVVVETLILQPLQETDGSNSPDNIKHIEMSAIKREGTGDDEEFLPRTRHNENDTT